MGPILCKNLLQRGFNVGGPLLSSHWSAYTPPHKPANHSPGWGSPGVCVCEAYIGYRQPGS